jgi:hypothetical protein
MLIGEVGVPPCRDSMGGLGGGDCENFLNLSLWEGDVGFGEERGEMAGEVGSSEEPELARLTMVAVSSETENVLLLLLVVGEDVELLGLSGNSSP